MSLITAPTARETHRSDRMPRPWWRWLLIALAFPPAGYIGHAIAGPVDSVSAAVIGGLVTGAGIGAAQWALLRHRGVGTSWIAKTATGLAVGLAAGAALVSYRTDISSLALMGAVSGLAVGLAQGTSLRSVPRMFEWGIATAALWALGWAIATVIGVDVSEQWVVFGISGSTTVTLLQSTFVGSFVPAEAVTS